MKKVVLSLLLVLTLCFSVAVGVYAEPDTGTEGGDQAAVQTENPDAAAPEAQTEEPAPVQQPAPPVEPAQEPAVEEEAEEADKENAFDIKTIVVLVWGIAVLVLLIVILAKSGNSKRFEKIEKQLKDAAQNRDAVYSKVSFIEKDVNIIKGQLDTVSREVSYANVNSQSYVPEPEPVYQPAVELSFEEKLNRALSDGTMSTLGLTAVDVKTVGGIIELNEIMGSNTMFYCRAGANETIEVYPDAKIRERAYDMMYSPWFDITRNSDNGKMVVLNAPLVLKENRASGRTDLISKGAVTVL
ncbi:MAG: hypothetical protein J6A05_07465 [Oscillospiraceae bacterium]|nr:hypothetical protein [Clostridia bacterium]MBP1549828.1 hypothetical protein [Oscillospiraceae bacterium]